MNKKLAHLTARYPILASLLIFAIALTIFSEGIDSRPMFSRGEGREAIVARDMVRLNNFILPFEDLSDLPTKPPLLQWGAILSFKLFKALGVESELEEQCVRFPSAFFGALGLAAFFYFLLHRFGFERSIASVLVLGSTFEWMRSSGHARVDMGFSAFTTITSLLAFSLLDVWRQNKGVLNTTVPLSQSGSKALLLTLGIGISSALAILGKGPAGLVFPILTALIFFLVIVFADSPRPKIMGVFLLGCLAIGCAVALSGIWYYLSYQQAGADFLHVHLFKENIGRFALIDGKDQGHVKPFYHGLLYLVLGFFPWSFLLPQTIRCLSRAKAQLLHPSASFRLFCMIWAGVVVLIVTISSAKRDVYLLPSYAPLAFLIVDAWVNLAAQLRSRSEQFLAVTSSLIGGILATASFVVIGVLLIGGLPDFIPTPKRAQSRELIENLVVTFSRNPGLILLPIAAAGLFFLGHRLIQSRRIVGSVLALSGSMLILSAFGNHAILPSIAAGESPKAFMEQVRRIVPTDSALYQLDVQFFSAMFYADRRVSIITDLRLFRERPKSYILVEEEKVQKVLDSCPGVAVLLKSDTLAANGHEPLVLIGPPPSPDAPMGHQG
jgi:4-amino-4-deoxy-L-arabinose transferase-like glycosyltransferase